MNNFNTLVLKVAIIILIICLLFIGWAIYTSMYGKNVEFPPVTGNCPDYWNANMENNSEYCENTLMVGNGGNNSNDPECQKFSTNSIMTSCQKFTLANKCDLTWEGITNNSKVLKDCRL